jgi:DNA mismatch repair protein MutS
MQQYHAAKAAHPDAILFFRMGDFYEMFYDDAVTAAKVLDIVLTSRNKGAMEEVPMAGVPHHAAHAYVARLLSKGYKVALCEQMADPSKCKGIVPREVVRVLTPSMVTDSEQLTANENQFLLTLDQDEQRFGLCLLDISTGELRATQLSSATDVMAEVIRGNPKELLLGQVSDELRSSLEIGLRDVAFREDAPLDDKAALGVLKTVLGAKESQRVFQTMSPGAWRAAARALRFAASCSPGRALPLRKIDSWNPADCLILDEVAQRHLEIVRSVDGNKSGTLLSLLDATSTSPGARLLRRHLQAPLVDLAQIRRRQDAVELFVKSPGIRAELRKALNEMSDMERLAVRASLRESTPKELGNLRDSLLAAQTVGEVLSELGEGEKKILGIGAQGIDTLEDLWTLLSEALVERPPALAREGGMFLAGFHEELDEARELQNTGTQRLTELETQLRTDTDIPTLKVKYTRVFGWYIEVTGKYLPRVPKEWRRKQTVAQGERYTNDVLDDLSEKISHAEERAKELESSLYKELVEQVAQEVMRLHQLTARLASWDVAAALAEQAHRHDFVRPLVDDSNLLKIEGGRHPVVEQMSAAGQFVPNDVLMDADQKRLWLITGPNMAGKSTLMRQVALIVILAQMGSFVPASKAHIGVVDRILSRVGASDNLSRGESTFMVEMRESASILNAATRRSLVILDEIGRGTSTYDGLAIAWAVAEHLHDITRCRALFATHYHELTSYADHATYAENHSVSAREIGEDIVFLHKLTLGAASRSYGIAVAKLAGIPEGVLARAKAILTSLEAGGALPSGVHASMRGRNLEGDVQMDATEEIPAQLATNHPILDTLRATDPDRLAPLDALTLVTKLKGMLLAMPMSRKQTTVVGKIRPEFRWLEFRTKWDLGVCMGWSCTHSAWVQPQTVVHGS